MWAGGRRWWAVVAFAAGLMCKPMLVTTPFVLLLRLKYARKFQRAD
jgi:hypothetical protein